MVRHGLPPVRVRARVLLSEKDRLSGDRIALPLLSLQRQNLRRPVIRDRAPVSSLLDPAAGSRSPRSTARAPTSMRCAPAIARARAQRVSVRCGSRRPPRRRVVRLAVGRLGSGRARTAAAPLLLPGCSPAGRACCCQACQVASGSRGHRPRSPLTGSGSARTGSQGPLLAPARRN
ncbi:hypothetical protein GQ55_4G061000 [Panicum hallii var. hallii]|uniref:Uncharacterized protein n=1 Tax=Panicum hallii var. hallii TaxID=1504633 RepID=A0A2T7DVS7_9POAL|nr:hypothetical protein GQ55_4G061000 [Panicum hallii var. hallii]